MKDLICFSHLRWDFVYQRPQHLMSRAAEMRRVYFIEEPIFHDGPDDYTATVSVEKVVVVIPRLFTHDHSDRAVRVADIVAQLFNEKAIEHYVFWYYTPMMLDIGSNFQPDVIVYDCMDELAAFKNADPILKENETKLFAAADIVFTGGPSLYRSKKNSHPNVFCFPSSIDFEHFAQARSISSEPEDQKSIPHPRLGFFGVVDERFDIEILREAAAENSDYHYVIIGPVVKIDAVSLPKADNIHYLGSKNYKELPAYLAGWDIALILFAMNESTKFISPTKTPEYLAAGRPVISTPIADVVDPYGQAGLVEIVTTGKEMAKKAAAELAAADRRQRQQIVDDYLSQNSWDITWSKMNALIEGELEKKYEKIKLKEYV